MRRRIQSESELKISISKPPLVAHSRSLNLSCDEKSYEMQLIGQEKEAAANCANLNSMQATNIEIPSTNDPENNLLLSNIGNISYVNDAACVSESIPLPRSSERPTSLSSVTSSRTSRGSDYFSSSSGIDSHPPLAGHNSGSHFELHSETADADAYASRAVLNKVVESVPEEEEGFVDDNVLAPDPHEDNMQKHVNNNSNKLEDGKFLTISPKPFPTDEKESGNLVSPKDINKKLSEVNYLSPIATMAMVANPDLSYVDRVIIELLETERMYVRALEDILAQYVIALKNYPAGSLLADSDTDILFGNIKDIYAFNRKLLSCLENCKKDPVKIAQHFVSQDSSFSVYTTYCTNYPISVAILTRCMKNPTLAQFFKNQQEFLGHNLPLGSYLLKPVQRILKYHLILQVAFLPHVRGSLSGNTTSAYRFATVVSAIILNAAVLQELVKNCDQAIDNYWIIEKALETMTNIARHINDMKRKHEDAVHVQEIQSLLSNWQGDDLTIYGDIVMEGELRLQGAKNSRLVFLLDKMILITKRQDGWLVCKANIMCSDITMLDGIKENPLSFRISHFDTPSTLNTHHSSRTGKEYTLIAKSMEDKHMWTHNIKKMMLKHHHADIPLQAQQSILNMNAAGLDDSAGLEENHRVPLRRMKSGLSSNTFANGKPRRRSDSASRKALPLRPWKKFEHDVSDDVSSDSVPNTPTLNHSKPRFSFPRIIHSKTDSTGDDNNTSYEQNGKSKKERKSDAKKSEKYKDSAVYRRHLRRTSQPITDFEKRLSVRAPSDQEEQEDDPKKKSEVSLEDFDSLEDFLSFNVENKRESLSWDLQIVEPFFDQLKKEKEEREALLAQRQAEDVPASFMIPMPNRKSHRAASSTASDSSSERESPIQQKSPSKGMQQPITAIPANEMLPKTLNKVNDTPNKISTGVAVMTNCTDSSIIQDTICTQNKSKFLEEEIRKDTKKNSAAVEEISEKAEPPKVEPVPQPKLKRSLSTQLSHTDRRRYFDRLKELRDRRHSQLTLGSDAKAIQFGKVREMIEQHQEQMMMSQAQIVGSSSNRKISDKNTLKKRDSSCDRLQNRKSTSLPKDNDLQTTVVLRRPRDSERISVNDSCDVDNLGANRYRTGSKKQNYRSMDLEIADSGNRFSAVTTASLPLHFTSSSSCSSGSGNEELSCNSPKPSPAYKAVLQSQMILWRSYSEDIGGSNRRWSKNLVIQASPNCKDHSASSSSAEKKFLFKDVGKIDTVENEQTDKLSEEVDCVWHNLEVCHKCHSNKLDSPLTPRSSFSTKNKSFPSSQTETKIKYSSPIAILPSKVTTNTLLKSGSFSTAENDSNQTQSTRQKTRVGDVNKRKKDQTQKENKRQGRIKERKSTTSSGDSTISVTKLAQKYNQLSASANASTSRPTYRRSQSAGARKHLSDLRFSTLNPKDQIKFDDVIKQTRKSSVGLSRNLDRSMSPPRRQPFDTVKSVEVDKPKNVKRVRHYRGTSAASSLPEPSPVNNPVKVDKSYSSTTAALSSPVEAICKPTCDVTTAQDARPVPSTRDIAPVEDPEQSYPSTSTSSSLVEALCKPITNADERNDMRLVNRPSTLELSPATKREKLVTSITSNSTLVEELCKPAAEISTTDVISSVSSSSTPEKLLSSFATSPSLVEELCKPTAVVVRSNDAINCRISQPKVLELHTTPAASSENLSPNTANSPKLVEELCKPFNDVAINDNDVTNQSQSSLNEDISSKSTFSESSDFIVRFCKM